MYCGWYRIDPIPRENLTLPPPVGFVASGEHARIVTAARRDALEAAAKVADTCKSQNGPLSARGFENNYRAGIESGAEAIAAAIRAMKDAPTDTPSHP